MYSGAGRMLDNRYRLGPVIGRGGMATVHSATDTRLRRAVAVKLFQPAADEITLARLEAEAKLLARLSHPGLLRMFDVSTSGGQAYLVMQLVSGCTLRTLINRGPMDPDRVARIGVRLAETLHYVHSRHVMHRDIKPSNVLLDGNGGCYLADFGIAKAIGAARLTASGHCVGTAAYLAPEQVAGARSGPEVDVYALGLVLLECLTGRPEYTGTETEAAIARLSRSPRVPDWVPPALQRALVLMTAREPGDRPDAARCVQLLGEHLGSSVDAPLVVDLPTPPENPTRLLELKPARRLSQRRIVHAAAAVAVLASLAVATAMSIGGPDPGSPAEHGQQQPVETAGPAGVVVPPQTAVAQVVVPPSTGEVPQQQQPGKGEGKPEGKPVKADKKKGGNGRG